MHVNGDQVIQKIEKCNDGRIIAFKRLAKCGTQVSVDREVRYAFSACNKQRLDLYVTLKNDAKFLKDNSINFTW